MVLNHPEKQQQFRLQRIHLRGKLHIKVLLGLGQVQLRSHQKF